MAACVHKIPRTAIETGRFSHLGIRLSEGEIQYSKFIVPHYDVGRTSQINSEGEEIIRKDLPMITKTYSFDTPNYGDWSNGSHTVNMDRKVYQRDHIPPSENEISIELVAKEGPEELYVFRFAISEVMDTTSKAFKDRLLFNLNLLLENVGAADVFASTATISEYLKTLYVTWELLPPGDKEGNINRILTNLSDSPEIREKIRDRYDFLEKLRPMALIQGHGAFKRYFGAKFSDSLVVFENMEYGNAIYVMFGDWAEQSKRSRQELLASGQEGKTFIRIPHVLKWKTSVKKIIAERSNKTSAAHA